VATWAVIGFGELGSVLARGLAKCEAVDEVRVYTRSRRERSWLAALQTEIAAVGARWCESLEAAIDGAQIVFAAVPAAEAPQLARNVASLAPGPLIYVDPAPILPEEKQDHDRALAAFEVLYVDAAVLGTVAVSGLEVPMLVSGPGAAKLKQEGDAIGLNISILEGPSGRASLVKLLRSVYMKGRDALVVEMLVAARRYELDETVMASVPTSDERLTFHEVANRVMTGLAVHAERRADELARAAEVVRRASLEPTVASAATSRLQWLANLGLRRHFRGERPGDYSSVLSAIEARLKSVNADAAD